MRFHLAFVWSVNSSARYEQARLGEFVASQRLHQSAPNVSSLRLTEHGRLTDNGCGRPD